MTRHTARPRSVDGLAPWYQVDLSADPIAQARGLWGSPACAGRILGTVRAQGLPEGALIAVGVIGLARGYRGRLYGLAKQAAAHAEFLGSGSPEHQGPYFLRLDAGAREKQRGRAGIPTFPGKFSGIPPTGETSRRASWRCG